VGVLDTFIVFDILLHISHTYVNVIGPITHVEDMFSGNGTTHVFILYISNHFDKLFISDILTESRAEDEYDWNDINHIVQRIARIVITTINSTRVNQWNVVETLHCNVCTDAPRRVCTVAMVGIFLILESVETR
jgi:hypothetical protein